MKYILSTSKYRDCRAYSILVGCERLIKNPSMKEKEDF